ncbi:DNA repair protein RecO [Caldanaerobius polysaccharolyticus]|uniref:DNA repair protein RecO n=1 Tax=Caldanaerobius polysaccharolyticus TaxID=44256 RepID=UPI00047E9421|nr:DNA repair protein RecO [Caldanaerobius polysaccharolyticus]
MKKFLKTQAVVVKCQDFGEADRLITLLTGPYGLLRAVVKGARKSKSRLAFGTQLLSRGYYDLYRGKTFYTVTQCESVKSFVSVYSDVNKFPYASAVVELVTYVGTEGQPNYPLYRLVVSTLEELDRCKENLESYLIYFVMKAISIAGFMPELGCCVQCKSPVEVPIYFSIREGGIVCPRCAYNNLEVQKVAPEVIAVLRYVLASNMRNAKNLALDDSVSVQINRLLAEFVSYYFDREFKSLKFIEKVSV